MKKNILYVMSIFFSLLCVCTVIYSKISFDIRNKDIGFNHSPNPKNQDCLEQQIFPGYSTTLYYNSVVEPSIAVNPKKHWQIVAAWQQDRFFDGGALDLGIAFSNNGGKNWHHTLVPFQNCNRGFSERVTDCWLSYAQDGKCVYLAALVFNASTATNTNNQEGIVVSVSQNNGQRWSIPHYIIARDSSFESGSLVFDKPTITADPCIEHRAYVVWSRFFTTSRSNSYISITNNCGRTWTEEEILYDPFPDLFVQNLSNGNPNDCFVTNNRIIGLPNGDLLNFMTRVYAKPEATSGQFSSDVWPFQYTLFDIAFVRSTDHGITWDKQATIVTTMDANEVWTCGYTYDSEGQIISGNGILCRTQAELFDVAVNPHNGNLYVVWQSSEFGSPSHLLPQIALKSSRNGGKTWSVAGKVNKTSKQAKNPQAFTPSVAINRHGHLGLQYHDFRKNDVNCSTKTKTNTWFAIYKETHHAHGGRLGVGLDFKNEVCVSEQSYMIENGPNTDQGVMTNGDYDRLVVIKDDFYGIYIQSFRGPFDPAQTIIDSPDQGTLILDNNKRTSPFFSKIDA